MAKGTLMRDCVGREQVCDPGEASVDEGKGTCRPLKIAAAHRRLH